MKKWIAGEDLLTRWNIAELDLYGYVKNGLQPYSKLGQPDPPPNIARIISQWKKCVRVIAKLEYIKKVPKNDEKLTYYKKESKRLKNEIDGITDYSWRNYDLPKSSYKTQKDIGSLLRDIYKIEDILEIKKIQNFVDCSDPLPPQDILSLESEENYFKLNGEFWQVGFEGKNEIIKNRNGLWYIALLLERPCEPIIITDLKTYQTHR